MSISKSFSIAKVVWLLAPVVMGLPLAMDVYIPAVPHMADVFHVSAGMMQLTLTLFMLVAGVMQLFIGPLSDHFGRRTVSLLVVGIFALGSVLCSQASNALELISFRGIQAVGACGMLVIAFAIVRDLFSGERSAKAYSLLNGIVAFSPMFAPFIGSYLDIHFDWPSTFLFLLFIAIWAGVNLLILPESLPMTQRIRLRWSIFREYKTIATNTIFMSYTLTTAVGLSSFYLFCSISPYIIIRLLHLPEADYGFYFAFMGVSLFIGSFIAAWLVGRIGVFYTVVSGLCLALIGGIIMLVWFYITGLTINSFVWPMLLIGLGGTFCMGAGNGGAMEPFAANAGTASALGGAMRFVFASIVGAAMVNHDVTSTLPLAMPVVVFSSLCLLMMLVLRKQLYFRAYS